MGRTEKHSDVSIHSFILPTKPERSTPHSVLGVLFHGRLAIKAKPLRHFQRCRKRHGDVLSSV